MILLIILIININILTNCYLFSIIISIYNTARYLDDTINSLLNQTIGLKEIQIILVNDGSTDDTENICFRYKNLFPNNIIYKKISHQGVSKGRNIGLSYAQGLYINFLDSDDKWDSRAFEYINMIFNLYKNVDLVSGRMKYFESKNNYHFLDYKFKKTRVVNLSEEYNCIQLSSASCFFRKSSIANKKFEEGILFGEDVRFIANLLLIKPLLGIVREAIYYYRKRSDSSSAIQSTEESKYYYFENLKNVQYYLINTSIIMYNKILPFIQYFIAYETIFRLKSLAYKYLDVNNYKNYCIEIENLLNKIEDKYILEQKIFPSRLIIFALSKKYKRDMRYDIILQNESFIYSNYILIDLKTYKNIIIWKIMEITDNILHLEGEDRCWLPREKFFYFCQLGNKTFFPKYYSYSGYDFVTMYGRVCKGRIVSFDIVLDIKDKVNLHFYLSYGHTNIEIFSSFDTFTHIPPIKNSYYITKKYIIKNDIRNLILQPYEINLQKQLEKEYCVELENLYKYNLIKLREEIIDWKLGKNNEKNNKIWIINDRKNKAGDNGEYFFRYLSKKKPEGIKFYFRIKNNCSDFKRLKTFGNILDLDSFEYFNLFLKANKVITSVSDSWVYNPFNEEEKYIRDLYHFDLIYLQNGIIKDNLSGYLNKFLKNFNLVITSSNKEYISILRNNYGYKEKDIVLTGLSRFDNLEKNKLSIKNENIILISPTWRNYIKGTRDLITHESIQSENFKKTNYFKFYNALINNDKFLDFMNKSNYKGIFCLHPNFEAQLRYFNKNKLIHLEENCNLPELILRSSLLITDYSSIFFDFGYIQKPVIYAHFDYKEYRNKQFPKGYFDYQKDGFGPICFDIECTIKTVILEIKNKCKLKYLYLKRIKRFFRFFDNQNCYRIYNEIIKYKNKNSICLKNKILYSIIILIILKILIRNKKIISYTFF